MPMLPVINPQRKSRRKRRVRRTGGSRGKMARKKRKRPARKAKRRRVARRKVKAAPKPKRRRRAVRRKRKLSRGKHRPVVTVRKGRLYRGSSKRGAKRSRIPKKARFANPLAGELAMIGNPRRKRRRKSSRRRRRNPARALALRGTPRRLMSQAREIVSVGFAQDAAAAAVGFVLPDMVVRVLPPVLRDSQLKVYASKVGAVAALAVAGNMVSKRIGRMIALGGGISLALDIWTDFAAPIMGGVVPAGASAYYGTAEDSGVSGGMDHYYGTADDSGVASSLADTY